MIDSLKHLLYVVIPLYFHIIVFHYKLLNIKYFKKSNKPFEFLISSSVGGSVDIGFGIPSSSTLMLIITLEFKNILWFTHKMEFFKK